jgi:hypothetical protein
LDTLNNHPEKWLASAVSPNVRSKWRGEKLLVFRVRADNTEHAQYELQSGNKRKTKKKEHFQNLFEMHTEKLS